MKLHKICAIYLFDVAERCDNQCESFIVNVKSIEKYTFLVLHVVGNGSPLN